VCQHAGAGIAGGGIDRATKLCAAGAAIALMSAGLEAEFAEVDGWHNNWLSKISSSFWKSPLDYGMPDLF
jgi:hypothetical protein